MTMDIDTALHELLLTRPVTENDIVQAHRRMAMRFHPDKAADPDEKRWAQQKFVQVQEAYELLKELPTETINASPDRKVSQETSGGLGQQPEECPPQQPPHEEPHLCDSSVPFPVVVLGLVMLSMFAILGALVGRPKRLSGSPPAQEILPYIQQTYTTPVFEHPTRDSVSLQQLLPAGPVPWTNRHDNPLEHPTRDSLLLQQQNPQTWAQGCFGHLVGIGDGPNGRFANFERINHLVYDGEVICGVKVRVLRDTVRLSTNGLEWTYSY
ncbi:MAG: J domain-containing protein [Phycisphaerae bacterium]|nr:J domain-containing protein [Phycisphaerae bacterium]